MIPHPSKKPNGLRRNTSFPKGISTVLIGRDTMLWDNPICFPVQNGRDVVEIPAVTVSVALPVSQPVKKEPQKTEEGTVRTESSKVE
jgi:hypothetical protein